MRQTPKGPQECDRKPLRFGILCEGTSFEAWQAAAIENLLESGYAEPALIVVDGRAPKVRRADRSRRQSFLWSLYFRHIVSRRAKCLQRVCLDSRLSSIPRLSCEPTTRGKYSTYFAEKDLEQIRQARLDFLLRFDFGILRGGILSAARLGVWSFHHGDPSAYRGRPAGFWEIYHREPVSGGILQRLTETLDNGHVLFECALKTTDDSYIRGLDRMYFSSAQWPSRVCAQIVCGNGELESSPPREAIGPLYRRPSNRQMIRFFLRLWKNRLQNRLREFFLTDDWHIGIVEEPIQAFLAPGFKPEIRWLPRTPGPSYLADPFGRELGGKLTILAEDFDLRSHRGSIVALEWDPQSGALGAPQPALELPHHLSYPFLLEHDGAIYCLPECHQSGALSLYRAVSFPRRWQKVATLIDNFAAVDATIIQHQERWWIFATDARHFKRSMLHIWHADNLNGPWRAHALNPVKTHICNSRPAGTPFVHEGGLFRPTQDCSTTYGGSVVLNRLVRLSPTEFEEQPVRAVEPDPDGPYPDGLHHLCALEGRTLIDGKRFIFSPSDLLRKIFGPAPRRHSPTPMLQTVQFEPPDARS